MDRAQEIKILIEYLKQDVINTANKFPALLADAIIKNGLLIETYRNELIHIK